MPKCWPFITFTRCSLIISVSSNDNLTSNWAAIAGIRTFIVSGVTSNNRFAVVIIGKTPERSGQPPKKFNNLN
jgi:hypothetical protein